MPDPTTWTVAQLLDVVQRAISQALGGDVWIEGEITSISRPANGHVYLQLAQIDDPAADELPQLIPERVDARPRRAPRSTLSVVLLSRFRRQVNDQLLRTGGAVRMTEGVRVRIRGSVEVYGPRSEIQLRMTAIDPSYTLASLGLERDRVLRALADAGLLELNGRLPVPFLPLRIAVLTSLGSAAHADFVDELARSGFGFEVSAFDVRVQGPHAAGTIVRAIERAAGHDLIAIVRGGGSRTDLAAFDDESLARAVAAAPTVIWSGVGHETDTTVIDHVAHTAFKTPTACAVGVVDAVRAGVDAFDRSWIAVEAAASAALDLAERRLARRVVGVSARSTGALDDAARRLQRRSLRVATAPLWRLDQADVRLGAVAEQVRTRPERLLQSADASLAAIATTVRAYDPGRALERGWSITRRGDGRLARASDLRAGTVLHTLLVDGEVRSVVDATTTVAEP